MLVAGALIPLTWLLLTRLVRQHAEGFRDAALVSAVLVGLGLVALAEAASAVGALRPSAALISWGAACAALSALVLRRLPAPGLPAAAEITREVKALVASVAVLVVLVLVVGIAVAPSNYDSLSYHLPRVTHWAQEGSLAHFPTSCSRQLYSNPFAELVILHGHLLTGGDRLANAVQGGALALTAVAASAIARRCGLSPLGQAWSALFAATLPTAILQGQTTQNDLVLAALLLTAGAFGLDVARGRSGPIQVTGWAGAIGLAVLTKGTAFMLAPFVVLAPAVALARRRGRRAAPTLGIAFLLAFAPNVAHWARNQAVFGHPWVPPDEHRFFQVERPTPATLASNAVRGAALHLALPSTQAANLLERAVRSAHDLVGLDADDPRTTFPGHRFALLPWTANEDAVSSTWHLLAALLALAVVASRRREYPGLWPVIVAVGLAALTVAALLKWQPWLCRLTLPAIAGLAPVVGAVVAARPGPRTRAVLAVAAVLIAGHALATFERRRLLPQRDVPWVLTMDREDQYFVNKPEYAAATRAVTAWLTNQGVRRVGLIVGGDDIEYPLWVFLGPRVHLEHVSFARSPPPHLRGAVRPPPPEHVLCVVPAETEALRAAGWRQVFQAERATVWRPPTEAARTE